MGTRSLRGALEPPINQGFFFQIPIYFYGANIYSKKNLSQFFGIQLRIFFCQQTLFPPFTNNTSRQIPLLAKKNHSLTFLRRMRTDCQRMDGKFPAQVHSICPWLKGFHNHKEFLARNFPPKKKKTRKITKYEKQSSKSWRENAKGDEQLKMFLAEENFPMMPFPK